MAIKFLNSVDVTGALTVSDTLTVTAAGGIDVDTASHASLTLDRASTSYDNNIMFRTAGDTKFRIWQDGNADYLYIRDDDNATNMVTFKKGGNVGIGTTAPVGKLEVAGNFRLTGNGTSNDSYPIHFTNTAVAIARGGNDLHLHGYNAIIFGVSSTGYPTSTERMRITNGGNVGIGTTAPAAKLDVNGDTIVRGNVGINGATSIDSPLDIAAASTSNNAAFTKWYYSPNSESYYLLLKQTVSSGVVRYNFSMVNNGTAYNDVLVLDRGNVGMGITTPSDGDLTIGAPKLHVAVGGSSGTFNLAARFQSTTTDADNTGTSILINSSNDRGLLIKAGRKDGDREVAYFDVVSSAGSTTNMLTMGKFDSAYNVGVGTATPAAKLHIRDQSQSISYMKMSAASNDANYGFFKFQDNTVNTGRLIIGTTYGYNVEKTGITVYNGNVGIGTLSTPQKLTVAGTIMSTASSNPTLILQDSTHSDITIKGDSGIFSVTNQSVGQNITMLYNGNIGIGTTSPTSKLHVNGLLQAEGINSLYIGNLTMGSSTGWYRAMEWTGSSRGGSVICLSATGGSFGPVTYVIKAYKTYGNPAAHNTLKLEQYGTNAYITAARITWDSEDSKAFVEVYKNVTGSMPLSMFQDKLIGYDATSTVLTGTASTGGGSVLEQLNFVPEGTTMEKLLISDSIAVGGIVNSTTAGRIDAANDVVAFSTSDIRLKDNIKSIDKALDKVNSIQGIEFDWIEKEEVHGNSGHDIGVIAQEIEEILPDVVTTRDNGYKAVKYEKIVPLLIEAIKDLSKQVDGLKRLI